MLSKGDGINAQRDALCGVNQILNFGMQLFGFGSEEFGSLNDVS